MFMNIFKFIEQLRIWNIRETVVCRPQLVSIEAVWLARAKKLFCRPLAGSSFIWRDYKKEKKQVGNHEKQSRASADLCCRRSSAKSRAFTRIHLLCILQAFLMAWFDIYYINTFLFNVFSQCCPVIMSVIHSFNFQKFHFFYLNVWLQVFLNF